MVCIAYNYHGQVISVVNAKSEELAMAYWHGAGLLPHTHKTENDFDPTINGTGVVPIVITAIKRDERDLFDRSKDLIIIPKNT